MTTHSNLLPALERLTRQSARAIVSRARLAAPGLNRWLMRELMRPAGQPDALLADPVIEVSRSWMPASETLGALAPSLLSEQLIKALDQAESERMPKDRPPYAHQLAAWDASLREQKSVLVTAGTGAGKTECFLIPILHDCLTRPRAGGVRAILLYPLNALIESQRERLSAWVRGLGGKVRFALLNGETPETEREAKVPSDSFELRSRQRIREQPPEILVTNITMLEYLLLRGADQPILERSRGVLRWVVLDEAHGYAGSQAAEMALLLRRVRASFGVKPDEVRLIATSATIGGEERTEEKLRDFAAALAGQTPDRVAVIEGRERPLRLPPPRMDGPLDPDALGRLDPDALGERLATHAQVQQLRHRLSVRGLPLAEIARELCGDSRDRTEAAKLLDHCARARWDGASLLPWRAHVFHRAQGGLWACPDAACPHRAPELAAEGANWPFGATWLSARAKCECGAPVYEVVACTECGTVHLEGLSSGGESLRLEPPNPGEGDDFELDAEPEGEEPIETHSGKAWLAASTQAGGIEGWLAEDGRWYDNAPPGQQRAWKLRWIDDASERKCCDLAGRARLQGLHYGPAFLIGTGLPGLLEDLAPPVEQEGLPCGGRRAISFSDSRQGVARIAAKLQQGAERELTRAFLWHAVQETPMGDPEEIAKLRAKIKKMEDVGLGDYAEDDRQKLASLTGAANAPIPWSQLVQDLSRQHDVLHFAGAIWNERRIGEEMQGKPANLAEMLLYRELFRRPRIQNNPETMGLLRLCFPDLEAEARHRGPPMRLRAAGLDADGWVGLAHVAMDLVFRQALAVDVRDWMVPLVAPRAGQLNAIVSARTESGDVPLRCRRWPLAAARDETRLSGLAKLIYALMGGTHDDRIALDSVAEVLNALWQLICGKAAKDVGKGAWRLDFSKAAVSRLDRAYLCPVTRRLYPYSLGGRSPNDPKLPMEPIELPRLPLANRGGLTRDQSVVVAQWCETDPAVQLLRERGLWSDLHDRLATYPTYVRAQEHSAQIPRPVLKRYEAAFKEGRINLLNCSTTMEMGVDLADVRLVVNTNVPPALSNYRQRAGRAGRRGEPWAFTVTYCRDLPLDRRTYTKPADFLQRPIVAPKVWFESAALVQRHVNAALLTAFLAVRSGTSVQGSIGAFMGASDSADRPVEDGALADAFLQELEAGVSEQHRAALADLVRGTVLVNIPAEQLVARTRLALDDLTRHWRSEHRTLLEAAAAALDKDARKSLELRAKRLRGEFLLGELARRGFTPAYGFPTDVVTFENLSHREREERDDPGYSHFKRGTAARSLDQALREYAPGAEVVIDGLVHRAEGILPAWEAGADASRLEDLRMLWSCSNCGAVNWSRHRPANCPHCGHESLDYRLALRPAGFLGNSTPHTGYESLAFVRPEPARLSAHGAEWLALPEGAGRMRADPEGRVAVTTAPSGLAICLDCGLAHPMEVADKDVPSGLPKPFQKAHKPLLLHKSKARTKDGHCPGSDSPQRIQRGLVLAQVKQTDVWEWQLPEGNTEAAALALAAALREALVERLGVESAEVIPSAAPSISDAGRRYSVFLHDRAAGGAGLCTRLADAEMLTAALRKATELLDCPEQCRLGCPACILRPDLNTRDAKIDRPAAHQLALQLLERLDLPADLQIFGATTRLAGQTATAWIEAAWRQQRIRGLDLWLHGDPAEWDLSNWPIRRVLPGLARDGIRARVLLPESVRTSAAFTLPHQLALHTLAESADIHLIDEAPATDEAVVLCQLRLHGANTERFAVTAATEALPGANWGLGSLTAAVVGPGTVPVEGDPLSTARLIEMGSGDARVLWPDSTLDGDVMGFGKRFWAWLEQHATLEIATLRQVGVKSVHYSDRYLLQAYTLRLLAEVLRAMPGRRDAAVHIDIARDDRPSSDSRFVHQNFPTPAPRLGVLQALIPAAHVQMHEKSQLPHSRKFGVELADGRRLELLLDQGFGAWRVRGAVRFNFQLTADKLARELAELSFAVDVDQPAPPIAVTMN